jgi:glycine cleavage system H lipoate-binding protein
MDNDLFWRKVNDNGSVSVGLTDRAFDLFGQLWSIIPVNDRKRNFLAGEPIVAVEGSDSLGSLTIPFTVRRISFNGDALDRPDELNSTATLLTAEVV